MSNMYDMSDKARFFVWNYICTHLETASEMYVDMEETYNTYCN